MKKQNKDWEENRFCKHRHSFWYADPIGFSSNSKGEFICFKCKKKIKDLDYTHYPEEMEEKVKKYIRENARSR